MKKRNVTCRSSTWLLALALCAAMLTGCESASDTATIPNAYINGFAKLYEQGNDYTEQGLQLQAAYAYGWAGASVSAMRCCVDCLLLQKGEAVSLEEAADGIRYDWDEIAALNYASPYPWYFEGLACSAQDKPDEARQCYENALLNPAFSAEYGEALSVLLTMSVDDLKAVRRELTALEDKILAVYALEQDSYPRVAMGFSDQYLRALARETLETDPSDYRGALRHYKAALRVNPFEGDNFFGCALMKLYLGEMDAVFFYVNEGLFVDPSHEGLNKLMAILNGEAV